MRVCGNGEKQNCHYCVQLMRFLPKDVVLPFSNQGIYKAKEQRGIKQEVKTRRVDEVRVNVPEILIKKPGGWCAPFVCVEVVMLPRVSKYVHNSGNSLCGMPYLP